MFTLSGQNVGDYFYDLLGVAVAALLKFATLFHDYLYDASVV